MSDTPFRPLHPPRAIQRPLSGTGAQPNASADTPASAQSKAPAQAQAQAPRAVLDTAETPDGPRLLTLAQLTRRGAWQLNLAQDRGQHLLVWLTRGQGVGLIDGGRAGIGPHNALFFPARSLFALDPGRQAQGLALLIPDSGAITLPRMPQHLRIRDGAAQGELTQILDAIGREQTARRPLARAAIEAHAALAAVWLRRQMEDPEQARPRLSAARKLVQAYCARLVSHHAAGEGVGAFAAALEVTPTHLTRVCRAETGRTALALLNERLVFGARHLLGDTEAEIQAIARHLGFASAASFTRFVQVQTKATPSALRKALRASG